MKRISVIIPFYKEFDLLPRALNSVNKQELPEGWTLEIVIGNDSNYENEFVLNSIISKTEFPILIAKNISEHCAGYARNAAIQISTGNYFAFLDADDYWLPGKLIEQCKLIENGYNFITTSFKFENRSKLLYSKKNIVNSIDLLCSTIGTSTILISKDLIGNDLFSSRRTCQDLELWATLSKKSKFKYGTVADILTIYCPSSRTKNKFLQLRSFIELVSTIEANLIIRFYIVIRYILRGINNHYLN